MAITFTAGYTFANAEKVTVTKINLAQTGLVLNCATARLLGRNTAGAGVVEELSASTARTLLGLATTDSPTFAGLDSPIGQVTPRAGAFTTLSATGTITGSANAASSFDNETGTYSRWKYNGSNRGIIGSANQAISGGSANDFAIGTENAGNLQFFVNNTTVAVISPTGLAVTGTHTVSGGFGCNGAAAQTPYASGGTLAGVVAALVANGILSN